MRSLLWVIAAAAVVVSASFFWTDTPHLASAHRAARNSAALSALFMAAAVAWRGGSTTLQRQARLVMNFVAAHAVHYAAVLSVIAFDLQAHLRQAVATAGALSFGVALLIGITLTA